MPDTLNVPQPRDIAWNAVGRWAGEDSTLFASRAWFEHWLAAFGDSDCGVWPCGSGESDCLIPYRIELRRVGPITLRVAVGATNSHTPQFDVVGCRGPDISDLHRMMRQLDVSVLVFPVISLGSKLAKALSLPLPRPGTFLDECEVASVIDCTGDWEAYVGTRSKKRTGEWRYKERRALKVGDRFQVVASPEGFGQVWEDVLAVEASGWKGRGGTAMRQQPAVRKFYDAILPDLAAAGKLRLFLHWRGNRIIAFHLCTLHGGRLCSLKSAYEEEFAKESPAQIVRWWMVKWAFENPEVRVVDFLGPVTETKRQWSTGVEELSTLYVFRRSARGILGWLRWAVWPPIHQRWKRSSRTKVEAAGEPPDGMVA